ncbi:RagB/SusD family nutrient uptake outer membrane protein [Chitinophaga sp. Cy-1792]|uniref:RagB/SusD family nutrient uptake outer membrane protein n=1 Tax=Chitinophaga sp. Cy-1792 TaxID=2608339 RepID=UPI0014207A43|nr:RagB/SusD family nutrient uptake outer membrane protein [Chitinophaga sp. Cy-1792]NIG53758.1 RagB/SusD family nutrient uptake outer membrane protein [Chitinophaga sp. Cy-1792]
MKRNYLVFLFLSLVTVMGSSCKKWLDVSPKTQVRESEMLSSEQGYKDALTGVYLSMGSINLYGCQLTMGALDLMGQRYTGVTGTTSTEYRYLTYNYTDAGVKTQTALIWSEMYAAIGNLNNILSHIDGGRSLFSGNSYNQVKGEALALRAMLHFDLLRMFGASPAEDQTRPAIPYVKEFNVQPTGLSSVKEVMDFCLTDLTAAAALLTTDKAIREDVADDQFKTYTRNHLNYWACKGLEARIRLYAGDKGGALAAAQEVISNTNLFPWIIAANASITYNRDRLFVREHLFALYDFDLKRVSDSLFKSANTSFTPVNSITTKALGTLYETSAGGSSDLRFLNQFTQVLTVNCTARYYQENLQFNYIKNQIPLIRLSEVYYIAAECAGVPAGVDYLNAVRTHRGLTALPANIAAASFTTEITKEYKKEFYGEGQLFYYFKRRNASKIDGSTVVMSTDRYAFPLPADEIQYGKH